MEKQGDYQKNHRLQQSVPNSDHEKLPEPYNNSQSFLVKSPIFLMVKMDFPWKKMVKKPGASWHAVCDQADPVLENLQEEHQRCLWGLL